MILLCSYSTEHKNITFFSNTIIHIGSWLYFWWHSVSFKQRHLFLCLLNMLHKIKNSILIIINNWFPKTPSWYTESHSFLPQDKRCSYCYMWGYKQHTCYSDTMSSYVRKPFFLIFWAKHFFSGSQHLSKVTRFMHFRYFMKCLYEDGILF